jgi:hypothetical protein
MFISTALLLDSIIRNSVCTPAKLPCRRVEVGYEKCIKYSYIFSSFTRLLFSFDFHIFLKLLETFGKIRQSLLLTVFSASWS